MESSLQLIIDISTHTHTTLLAVASLPITKEKKNVDASNSVYSSFPV